MWFVIRETLPPGRISREHQLMDSSADEVRRSTRIRDSASWQTPSTAGRE